jgi:hypothetical protein
MAKRNRVSGVMAHHHRDKQCADIPKAVVERLESRVLLDSAVFDAPKLIETDGNPKSIMVSDFNGDGKSDLAVAMDTVVSIWLGNGDGTFRPHVDFALNWVGQSVAVGDFNGDGKADLAVGNARSTIEGTVSILLGNGDGTFQLRGDYSISMSNYAAPSWLVVGDFNHDGNSDLVAVGGALSASPH